VDDIDQVKCDWLTSKSNRPS